MTTTAVPTTQTPQTEWGTELLDLDAYLRRIGDDGPRAATLETLRRLHRKHVDEINFETVGMALGGIVTIDMPTLQEKIVESGHGGGCLEQNLLFAAVLEQLGFSVTRMLSRVRRGNPQIRYRSHAVLLVEADGKRWLADVGFGDEGPLEPILFEDGATMTIGEWTWRLDKDGEDWVLRCLHADGWFDVYSLREENHHQPDFAESCFYTCHNPKSPFVGQLVAQRGTEKLRHVLKNTVLTTQHPDGRVDSVELTPDEVVHTLRETFRVNLTDEEADSLRRRFSDTAEQG